MIENYRKITTEDYIPDMVNTLNHNFEAINEALSDLDEIVNNGDAEFTTIKNNVNGDKTAVAYEGKGRIVNDGNFETTTGFKGKTLELSDAATFNGTNTYNGNSNFNSDVNLNGENLNLSSYTTILKGHSIPIRFISSVDDTGTIGAVNNIYTISVENDEYIILNEIGSDLKHGATYNFINAKPNQVIHFITNSLASTEIYIQLNNTTKLKILNNKDIVSIVFNETTTGTGTGEWIIIGYSFNFEETTRII